MTDNNFESIDNEVPDYNLYFIDFGLAKKNKKKAPYGGTIPYIHPQIYVLDRNKVDKATDIYALAISYFVIEQ